jgi:hypothetical protein
MQDYAEKLERKARAGQNDCNEFRSGYDWVYDESDAQYITEHLDEYLRDIETEFQKGSRGRALL